MRALVSTVIPAYNTGRYVVRAVESVLAQTVREVEVVVVDDASTDDTAEVVRGVEDGRVRLISCAENGGPSRARNLGLEAATGEWVALLDSDDWFAPERLERLLEVAEARRADMVSDDVYLTRGPEETPWNTLFGTSREVFPGPVEVPAPEFVDSNLPGERSSRLGLTKPVMRREFLERSGLRYDETARFGEDFLFYLECLLAGARFVVVPEAYYYYLSRPGSLVTEEKLKNLSYLREMNRSILRREDVRRSPELVRALKRRQAVIEGRIAYYRIVQPVKGGELSVAVREAARNPAFVAAFARQVPRILRYRLGRRFRRVRQERRKPL